MGKSKAMAAMRRGGWPHLLAALLLLAACGKAPPPPARQTPPPMGETAPPTPPKAVPPPSKNVAGEVGLETSLLVVGSAAPPASAPPSYGYLLSDKTLRSGHDTVLSVGVSTGDVASLDALLKTHQVPRSQEEHAHAAAGSGQLATSSWSSFQYIKAGVLHCPAFLSCEGDPVPRHIDGNPMIWDFVLSAKDSSRTQDGVIIISFSGAASVDGPYVEIASLPGLMAGVNVVRDATWWEQKMTGWEGVLNTLHGLLEALGAVLVLLWGWRGWLRLRLGKADAPPAASAAGTPKP
jgi:hypothetical protein